MSSSMIKKSIFCDMMDELCDYLIDPDEDKETPRVGPRRSRNLSQNNSPSPEKDKTGKDKGPKRGLWGTRKKVTNTNPSEGGPGQKSSKNTEGTSNRIEHGEKKLLSEANEEQEQWHPPELGGFWYKYTCFEAPMTDDQINRELQSLPKVPEKWQLSLIFWRSYLNQTELYIGTSKYLISKLFDPKGEQNNRSRRINSDNWGRCVQLVEKNFMEQSKHVANIFCSLMERTNLDSDELKKGLEQLKASWEAVTMKANKECISVRAGSSGEGQQVDEDNGG
ncbi:hypothetical protein C922_05694 [Plasmodium inui San Antonio 1]|uniref:Plasmodium RESA N-terminal domain-containing protein n=1 Tax=Plasmodium inui San Antonio 1 TaxID=1237626 RepID=W7AF65_9APIC|nr:hypothetical protein C922_05694 [Plasmodium inui San Antonio 1]EUD63926.1 hypothetical protein C922_05694 [Plasmodium inui San Antonio 1]